VGWRVDACGPNQTSTRPPCAHDCMRHRHQGEKERERNRNCHRQIENRMDGWLGGPVQVAAACGGAHTVKQIVFDRRSASP
jgi:hypothetical protein